MRVLLYHKAKYLETKERISMKEILEQINKLKQNGLWEEITKLLKAEDGFEEDMPLDILGELAFAYSKIATNMVKIDFAVALKNYGLAEQAFATALARKDSTEKQRLCVVRTWAYTCYSLYADQSIWSPRFRASNYTEENKAYMKELGFYKAALLNKALVLYAYALNMDKKDVKTLYRAAKLLSKLHSNLLYNASKGKQAKAENTLAGTEAVQQLLAFNAAKVRQFVNFNDISALDTKTIALYEEAIVSYRQANAKEQKRNKNEYLKALYNACVWHIDKVSKYNDGRKNPWELIVEENEEILPAWCGASFGKLQLVQKGLWEILAEEGLPADEEELAVRLEEIYKADLAEQANFVYYRIAKFIMAYRVQKGDMKAICNYIKFLKMAIDVDVCIAMDIHSNKSHSPYPYEALGQLIAQVGETAWFEMFVRKYAKCGAKFNYIRKYADICQKAKHCEFEKLDAEIAELRAIDRYGKNKSEIDKLVKKINAFKNDASLREETEKQKQMAIVLRNAIQDMCKFE